MRDSEARAPWVDRPALDVDLSVPPSSRFAGIDDDVIRETKALLAAVMAEIPAAARAVADLARLRTGGRFHAEVTAMADRAGVAWRDLMLANIAYDLVLSLYGCSTMALATAAGPVLARNMDWWPEAILARCSYAIRFRDGRDGDIRFINFGWPGAVGVATGMSGRGFAVALNAVIGGEGVNRAGFPVLLHLRRVLEDAGGYDEAVSMLSDVKLAAPALFTIAGTRNDQRLVIERSPTRHAHRVPEGDAPLIATNDYRQLFRTEAHEESLLYRTTCARFDALTHLTARLDPATGADDAMLLYFLSDPDVIQDITAQHVIMRPSTMQSRLCVPRRLLDAT